MMIGRATQNHWANSEKESGKEMNRSIKEQTRRNAERYAEYEKAAQACKKKQ